jgi:hypothetical protein
MAFIEVPVDTIMSRLQCSTFSALFRQKTYWGKNAEAASNGHICQLLSVFQRFVTHSRVAHAAHQAISIKASLLCASVQFQRSNLLCFDRSVDLQNLVKIKGVP